MINLKIWGGEVQPDEDMSKKFAPSFIKVLLPGDKDPCVINVVGFAGMCVQFYPGHRREAVALPRDSVVMVSPLPPAGVYSLKDNGGVVIVRRNPARQWHEGLCNGNTHISVNGEKHGGVDWNIATTVFADQVDIPLEQALATVKPGKSLRVNSEHWIKADATGETVHLFRMGKRQGSWASGVFFCVKGPKFSSRVCANDWREELAFNHAD